MRLFHFICANFGLEDIEKRRLMISLLQDLNDPFELLSIELSNKELRRAFLAWKRPLSENRGILCFSSDWSNPVQWSHYADGHRGLCLGFEIPQARLVPVQYTAKRLAREAEQILARSMNEDTMLRLLSTKYSHWKYEREVRCFLTLEDKDPVNGLYFANFSNDLKLVQVIVGARSEVSRADLGEALGPLADEVVVFKARLAFRSFRVVRNRRESLWV